MQSISFTRQSTQPPLRKTLATVPRAFLDNGKTKSNSAKLPRVYLPPQISEDLLHPAATATATAPAPVCHEIIDSVVQVLVLYIFWLVLPYP